MMARARLVACLLLASTLAVMFAMFVSRHASARAVNYGTHFSSCTSSPSCTTITSSNCKFFSNLSQGPLDTTCWDLSNYNSASNNGAAQCDEPANYQTTAGGGAFYTTRNDAGYSCVNVGTNTSYVSPWASAALSMHSFSATGGTIEATVQLPPFDSPRHPSMWMLGSNCQKPMPSGYSTLPAWWPLLAHHLDGCNPWAAGSEEIDIWESVYAQDYALGSDGGYHPEIRENAYSGGPSPSNPLSSTNFIDPGFDVTASVHKYSLVWVPGTSLKYYIDGVLKTTITSTYVPNDNMYVMFIDELQGTAVGGGVDAASPQGTYYGGGANPATMIVQTVAWTQP